MNLLCVIGICAVSAALLLDLRRDAARQADLTSRSLVQLLGRDIARNIENYDLALRDVVEGWKRPELAAVDAGAPKMLFNRTATTAGFGTIIVLDKDGNAFAKSQPLPAPLNGSDQEYFRFFKVHADDRLHISPPATSTINGKPVMILSRRLSNPDGSFGGVVAGAILVDYFRGLFTAAGADHSGTVTLYAPGGLIVLREPFSAEVIGIDVSKTPSYRKIAANRSGSFLGPAMTGSGSRYFVFAQVGDLPLKLSIGLAPDEIFSSWRWKAISLGGVVLFLCAVTMMLTWLFRRELRHREYAERATAAINTELEKLATTDALTGLFNRRRFDEALARETRRALRTGRPLSLLLLDADCFKAFNDRYGHQNGDEALRMIARAIAAGSDPARDVACRIGGEEFAVIFPDTDLASAQVAAEGIRAAVAAFRMDHAANDHGVLTVSGGVAQIPSFGVADNHSVVAAADAALYEAKRLGRNRIVTAGQAMLPRSRIVLREQIEDDCRANRG